MRAVTRARGATLTRKSTFSASDTPPGPLPLLETLVMRTEEDNRAPFFGDQILNLLCAAPNLVESTLHMRPIENFTPWEKWTRIAEAYPTSGYFTFSTDPDSAPPLQELVLSITSYCGRPDDCLGLFQCFIIIPTLTRLELRLQKPGLVAAVFTALAGSHSLLPNLRSLIIDLPNISESAWREALPVASLRRSIHFDIFSTCNPRRMCSRIGCRWCPNT
ncbi:hypothetical protein B0H14DRAFT_2558305 [Mycena olivaceomarginata]|nr:hypothetical protein B0H14DRAFT_2558305 [Mycena olivaceomarginata]